MYQAISIGDAVPRIDFDAVVHSVFRSSLNLRLHNSDHLLTLTSSEADLPQGIRVDTPDGFTFENFHVGEQVTCRDENLRLDSLTVDLRRARHWQCDLPALKADTTSPAFSTAWNFVWDALNKRQKLSNAEIIAEDSLLHTCRCERTLRSNPLFSSDVSAKSREEIASSGRTPSSQRHNPTARTSVSRKAGEAMRDLLNVTRRYDSTDTSAVNSLIGLGSGLTPSGDDLLVGYMAGLWCAVRDKSERVQFVSDLGDAIIRHSKQTNDISRIYLYHASLGQVSSLLANLAEAICMGVGLDRLLAVAENAMRIGHTSGMEAVTGLLIGLTAWDGNHLLSN